MLWSHSAFMVYVVVTQCLYGFHVVFRIKRIYFINHL